MKSKISPYKNTIDCNNTMKGDCIIDTDCVIDKIEDIGNLVVDKGKMITKDVKENVEVFYTGWKTFVFKESIINIAVGMIVATSFKNTVNSLVVDMIMPLIVGFGVQANVHDLFVVLVYGEHKLQNSTYITLEEAKKDGAVTLNYGLFINIFFDLIFVTLCLYTSLKLIYKIKKKMKKEMKKLTE